MRYAVLAHYDPNSAWLESTDALTRSLSDACDEVLVVSAGGLNEEGRSRVGRIDGATLMERTNIGHDFGSYRDGLLRWRAKVQGHEVVLTNDSYVMPRERVDTLLGRADLRRSQAWGVALSREIAVHLQSYFLLLGPSVTADVRFWEWWEQVVPVQDKRELIKRYEVGFSRALVNWGYTLEPLILPRRTDHFLGSLRVVWAGLAHRRAMQLAGAEPGRAWNARRLLRALPSIWIYNPTHAFADQAFSSRAGSLPIVKWEILRDDPWCLGADKLAAALDEMHPEWAISAQVKMRRGGEPPAIMPGPRVFRRLLGYRPIRTDSRS